MSKHTPGLCKTVKPGHGHKTDYRCVQIGNDDTYTTLELLPADGRRLVAAWNACEGISTEALEGGAVSDLLAACREALEEEYFLSHGVVEQLRAAIALAEGGEGNTSADAS